MSSNGSANSVGYDEATGIGMCTAVDAANGSSQGFSRGSITNTIYGIIVLLAVRSHTIFGSHKGEMC